VGRSIVGQRLEDARDGGCGRLVADEEEVVGVAGVPVDPEARVDAQRVGTDDNDLVAGCCRREPPRGRTVTVHDEVDVEFTLGGADGADGVDAKRIAGLVRQPPPAPEPVSVGERLLVVPPAVAQPDARQREDQVDALVEAARSEGAEVVARERDPQEVGAEPTHPRDGGPEGAVGGPGVRLEHRGRRGKHYLSMACLTSTGHERKGNAGQFPESHVELALFWADDESSR
jgi:hypothetical protein